MSDREDADGPRTNLLISRRKVREFIASHPSAARDAEALYRWCKVVESADWRTFADVRATFAGAGRVGARIVFNVGGNKYRVVASARFRPNRPAWIYLKHVLTHKEYDEGRWRDED